MRTYLLRNTDRFMSFVDRWSRKLAWAAVVLAFIVIILPAFLTCGGAKSVALEQPTDQEKKEINRLFKKHGVYSAVCDRDGTKCYFIRDGKKCRLM